MEVIKQEADGLIEIIPDVFGDSRGYFYESYHKEKFESAGITAEFVQDNQSFSTRGVLRGLHFQFAPYAQAKLVRVIQGKVLDVVVDLRKSSQTFGQVFKFMLDAEKKNMVYVPEGFAHGFSTIEDAIFHYKCSNLYNKPAEGGILWNDQDLGIDWELDNPVISEKDQALMTFQKFKDTYQTL